MTGIRVNNKTNDALQRTNSLLHPLSRWKHSNYSRCDEFC